MEEWILDKAFEEPFHEEPFRARSYTWPLPPSSLSIKSEDVLPDSNNNNNISLSGGEVSSGELKPNGNSSSGLKKNSSRRNAWGNMSYADLITQAIQSSSEKRLTLSQIYDWMVQNVPYFKDKGDSNSSAGWKNSIRHNLSLHNRFKRVQNEGTGKSSWWVINPEAKPGKAARRRATSMEAQKYEKKRGRACKKKLEAIRNGTLFDDKQSPGSSTSEGLDMFPESPLHTNFQSSPDFRPRASSNASSCGRLSPIIVESEIHDDHASSLSPISSWNSDLRSYTSDVQDAYTEKLVEMANTMKLGGPSYSTNSPNSPSQSQQQLNHHQSQSQSGTASLNGSNSVTKSYTNLNSFGAQGSNFTYSTTSISCNSINQSSDRSSPSSMNCNSSDSYFTNTVDSNITLTTLNALNNTTSPNKSINSEATFGSNQNSANSSFSSLNISPLPSPSQSMDLLSSSNQINSSSTNNFASKDSQQQSQSQPVPQQQQQQQQPQSQQSQNQQQSSGNRQSTAQSRGFGSTGLDNNTLRRINNSKLLGSLSLNGNNGSPLSLASLGATASQVMGHILSFNNPLPNDLDLNMESLQGGLECDVDQVIKHELSVEGNLDFNFESMQASDDNSIQGLNGTFRSSQMSNI